MFQLLHRFHIFFSGDKMINMTEYVQALVMSGMPSDGALYFFFRGDNNTDDKLDEQELKMAFMGMDANRKSMCTLHVLLTWIRYPCTICICITSFILDNSQDLGPKIYQNMQKYIQPLHLVIQVFHRLFLSNINSCVLWILLPKFSPILVGLHIVVYVVYDIFEFSWGRFFEMTW